MQSQFEMLLKMQRQSDMIIKEKTETMKEQVNKQEKMDIIKKAKN